MKVLFDQGVPRPLRFDLPDHLVDTAREKGWSELTNGDLLDKAETEGYDVLITTDRNMRFQQNLARRSLAILVLSTTSWHNIRTRVEEIQTMLVNIQPGDVTEVLI